MTRFTVVSIVFFAAVLHGASARGIGDEDGQFVVRAASINLQQTADAHAAAEGTQRSEILSAARSIARDHARTERRLTSLAAQKGMTVPKLVARPAEPRASDPEHIARLLKGGEEAVAVFHQEAVRGEDPDLQRFAQISLTALQQKMTMLRFLQEEFPVELSIAPQSD